jgi:hypothetical protein
LVKSPADLAKGKGIPKNTKIGIRATAEPSPPRPKTKETRKEIKDTSR